MCFFSIIIPIYNAGNFLEKTLDSVVNQEFNDYEVIMINDGSSDNSEELCRRYAEKYPNYKYLKKQNSGVSDTRNKGISIASGKYIIFLDSDDFLRKNTLKVLNKKIISNSFPDIVLGNHYTKYDEKLVASKPIEEKMFLHNNHILEKKVIEFNYSKSDCGNLRTVWAKAFSAQLIKKNNIMFNKNIRIGEDMAFFLECICNSKNYLVINDYLYEYVIRSTSVMHSIRWKGFNQNIQYLKEIERIAGKYSLNIDTLPVWLEISEKEWLLYDKSEKNISAKYRNFADIMKDSVYKEYSKKEHNASKYGILFGMYNFCIRHKLTLLFMVLVKIKNIKLSVK